MPDKKPVYITAYYLQQKDGLTPQGVINLAEQGPAYWKAIDREYQPDGFDKMKNCLLTAWDKVWADYEKLSKKTAPDKMDFYTRKLYSKIADYSDGNISLPLDNINNIKQMFETFSIERPRGENTDDEKWLFLLQSGDDIYDLVFQYIFQKRLFFDRDNQPNNKIEKIAEPAPKDKPEIIQWIDTIQKQIDALPADQKTQFHEDRIGGKQVSTLFYWLKTGNFNKSYQIGMNKPGATSGGSKACLAAYGKLTAAGIKMPFPKDMIQGQNKRSAYKSDYQVT